MVTTISLWCWNDCDRGSEAGDEFVYRLVNFPTCQRTALRAASMKTIERSSTSLSPTNAMSVDVEDYFQVSAFESVIPRTRWDFVPCRVERNTYRVLDMFDVSGISATFFVLGWVAERFPGLINEIVARGHELASHGYQHVRVTEQSREQFRADVCRTKALLEDTGAVEVRGYRAASYSIGEGNLWALEVLAEAGHQYSSSVYPIHHDLYGMPSAPRFPFRPNGSEFLEIPVSTVQVFNWKMPCGGGGYFRLAPYAASKWAIARVNRVDNQPCVFYFHPWEIDPDQPRQKNISAKTRVRHYLNLERTERRLARLLKEFRWGRLDRIFLENTRVAA